VDEIEAWFLDYQATGDPAVRERIILAHLGLAARFHDGNEVAASGWRGQRQGGDLLAVALE
jgi:hypothetical protein